MDGDGQWDEAEPPLMGAVVVISGGALGGHVLTTDNGGQIEIHDLAPGEYLVRVEDLPGRHRTTSRTVKLAVSPATRAEAQFGFRVPPLYLPIIGTSSE